MDKKTAARLIAFGVLLSAVVNRLDIVSLGIYRVLGIFKPVLWGLAMAFVLNIPLRLFENLGKKRKMPRGIGILLSVVLVLAIVAAVGGILLPQLAQSTYSLLAKLPEWAGWLREQAIRFYDNQQVREWISGLSINWANITENTINFFKNGALDTLSSAATVAGDVVGSTTSFIIAFMIALGVLADKEGIAEKIKRLLKAFLKPERARKTIDTCALASRAYVGFFTAQLTEAVILGALVVTGMLLLGFPRPFMVATLVSVGALIPMFGAFAAAFISALLIAAEFSLMQGVWFMVFFILLQQVEGNVIYPRVMGSRIGLPSLWVLVAIVVGANAMGILGMILVVPLASVVYSLLGMEVRKRENALKSA